MTVRVPTYALARTVPYLMERGAEQTLQFPLRDTATGALVEPDDTSTIQIESPASTDLVTEQVVESVTSSIAQFTLTPAVSVALGAGYTVLFTPIIGGVPYPTFRERGYVGDFVFHNTVTPDNVGWQPQIDEAYYEMIRQLLDDGRPIWEITEESTGVYEWMLSRALLNCVNAIDFGPDSNWARLAKDLRFRMDRADGSLKLQYSTDEATVRRSGTPTNRLAPSGRPVW